MEDNLFDKLVTYEYLVMPFGLYNAPAAFHRWINEVLMEHIDMCCIVYLDGVLIYSNTIQQHRKDVSNILEAIRKSGMKVKPSKCEFPKSETEYLGFIIGQEGVKTDPVKTQAIWDWTAPKKIKEIECFLGFCNFYQRFIEGVSRTTRPLYTRTKTDCIGKHQENLGVWSKPVLNAPGPPTGVVGPVVHMIHSDLS